jgi:hypothetical protein
MDAVSSPQLCDEGDRIVRVLSQKLFGCLKKKKDRTSPDTKVVWLVD